MMKLFSKRRRQEFVETWDILSYGSGTHQNKTASENDMEDEFFSYQLTKPMQLCFINDLPSDDEDDYSESTLNDTNQSVTPTGSEDDEKVKYLESDDEKDVLGDLHLHENTAEVGDDEEEINDKETDLLLEQTDGADSDKNKDNCDDRCHPFMPNTDKVLKHGEYRSLMVDLALEEPKQIQPPPKRTVHLQRPVSEGDADLYVTKKTDHGEENEDFLTKQARLQAEARMALAQVRPMAHMQLEVEKQSRKKSPIAEMVGIPGFGNGRKKRLTKNLMYDMNVAQAQVLVNDLHSQIEALNEELVKLLVERDDLHMEQDSMLVDIEDLTRHFSIRRSQLEYAQKQLSDHKQHKKLLKRAMNGSSSGPHHTASSSTRKK